ncbi:uncharacterized protein LOC131255415 [Magnolia sinica]|uniref:uncharacterized protein LOC131255415 n=1 Tax=Magnolia sinica TaxID=86752 RepID=UPI00265B6645|nr:uncharacterized protein LOC131255415 [Magnolia sinica]
MNGCIKGRVSIQRDWKQKGETERIGRITGVSHFIHFSSPVRSRILSSSLEFLHAPGVGFFFSFEQKERKKGMGSDPGSNVSSMTAFSRDMIGRKKRTNRSAKLKQCKLDARREQWLSQVKNKGGDKEMSRGSSPNLHLPLMDGLDGALGNFETKSTSEGNEGSNLQDSDSESLTNSTGSTNFGNVSSRKEHARSSSSSSSNGCFSRSISQDEEEEEDGCLDDWEAVADALTAKDNHCNLNPGSPTKSEITVESAAPEISYQVARVVGISKLPCEGVHPRAAAISSRAWRPDDAFRPLSLPNLSKQHSFPVNMVEGHFGRRNDSWSCHGMVSQPSSCPICYEDLDLTDFSFLPCSCGFHLCLFCHKRILEADGRCPGCRKQYSPMDGEMRVSGGAPLFRLARSCSMNSRS